MIDIGAEFALDPGIAHLNHGSYGACPRTVLAAQRQWQDRLERQPVAFMDPRHLRARFAEVRTALAAALGAQADDLFWATNATEALNLVARSLALKPGDEIVTTDHEYGALDKTWDFVCRRTGATIRRVAIDLPLTDAAAFTDRIASAFGDRTRVLFLSHVTSPTALVFPIGDAVARARARGILTVIDGAHGPGLVTLNLDAIGADFYAGNCHKWLLAPKGAGFLHVRPAARAALVPGIISHGWAPDLVPAAQGPLGDSAFLDAFQFRGTRDPSAWLAVPGALDFRRRHGWPDRMALARETALDAARAIAARFGLPLAGAPAFLTQMVAAPIPPCDPVDLHDRLLAEDGIEIPVIHWNGRHFVRLSVQAYTRPADIARLMAALDRRLGK